MKTGQLTRDLQTPHTWRATDRSIYLDVSRRNCNWFSSRTSPHSFYCFPDEGKPFDLMLRSLFISLGQMMKNSQQKVLFHSCKVDAFCTSNVHVKCAKNSEVSGQPVGPPPVPLRLQSARQETQISRAMAASQGNLSFISAMFLRFSSNSVQKN